MPILVAVIGTALSIAVPLAIDYFSDNKGKENKPEEAPVSSSLAQFFDENKMIVIGGGIVVLLMIIFIMRKK